MAFFNGLIEDKICRGTGDQVGNAGQTATAAENRAVADKESRETADRSDRRSDDHSG